jgi:uncharacterized protein YndB with AHSA1/START domain
MTTRSHTREETFAATPERVFALLITPSDIQAWWGVHQCIVIPEPGGLWAATWGEDEDDPDYVTCARLVEYDPPRKLVMGDYTYRAKANPMPFASDFVTSFEVIPGEAGTTLRVVQDGFPASADADDFYASCEIGWRDTFLGIRQVLEG